MLIFGVLIFAVMYPSFAVLLAHPSFAVLMAIMFLVGLPKAGYFAPLPAMMADLFPLTSRATGMAVSDNVGVTLFGGTTPVLIVWLTELTGTRLAPTYYLMFLAALSLACVLVARRMSIR